MREISYSDLDSISGGNPAVIAGVAAVGCAGGVLADYALTGSYTWKDCAVGAGAALGGAFYGWAAATAGFSAGGQAFIGAVGSAVGGLATANAINNNDPNQNQTPKPGGGYYKRPD